MYVGYLVRLGYGFGTWLVVLTVVLFLDWLLIEDLISELCFLVGFGCCGFVLELLV